MIVRYQELVVLIVLNTRDALSDSCGSSGGPITTAPIDLEIVDPDPVSTGLQWLRMYYATLY